MSAVVGLGIPVAQTEPIAENGFFTMLMMMETFRFHINMVHLGSWFVPKGGASGFNDVHVENAAVDFYRQTGEFPDGAAPVKELRAADQGDYATGQNVSLRPAN